MRKGTEFKRVRRRKAGGGDIYIEENILNALDLGENIEFSTHLIEGQHAILLKFRRKNNE